MLHQSTPFALLVVGRCCLCRDPDRKALNSTSSTINRKIVPTVRGRRLQHERASYSEVISSVAGPLVINLEEAFLYACRNLRLELLVDLRKHAVRHHGLAEWRPFLLWWFNLRVRHAVRVVMIMGREGGVMPIRIRERVRNWSHVRISRIHAVARRERRERSIYLRPRKEMIRPQEATTRGGVCHGRGERWRAIERSQLGYRTGLSTMLT